MTALTIFLVSLFILAPLSIALAFAKDSGIGIIVSIIVTVIVHVTFWVMFESYVEDHGGFALAGIYECATICGALAVVIEALELR